jgi:hypothetical protein
MNIKIWQKEADLYIKIFIGVNTTYISNEVTIN